MASPHLQQREITQKYDRFARWYDWVEGVPEALGLNRLRQRVVQRASGKVLEVAMGPERIFRTIKVDPELPGWTPVWRC